MRKKFSAVCGLLLFVPLWAASALPVTSIVSFGDSLSDNGNASIATVGVEPGAGYGYRSVPGVPFPVGEFTNPTSNGTSGLWIDDLASRLSLPDPQPFLAGGTNYAVGSALTGSNGLDGVSDQLAAYRSTHSASSTVLYSFWAGSNDILQGANPVQAANNIESNISTLAAAGGRYFLWLNEPLLGDTPEGAASGQATALNAASAAFNLQWAADIQTLEQEYPGIDLIGVDIAALFNSILTTPGHDGLNVTDAAMDIPGADPNAYLSWDGLHPTTAGHELVAEAAFDALPTPEPGSFACILLGFTGLAGFLRLKAVYRR